MERVKVEKRDPEPFIPRPLGEPEEHQRELKDMSRILGKAEIGSEKQIEKALLAAS